MRTATSRIRLSALLAGLVSTLGCAAPSFNLRSPYGIVALILLIFQIWAIVEIVQSGKPLLHKVLWIILVLAVPLIGVIVYFLAGRGR